MRWRSLPDFSRAGGCYPDCPARAGGRAPRDVTEQRLSEQRPVPDRHRDRSRARRGLRQAAARARRGAGSRTSRGGWRPGPRDRGTEGRTRPACAWRAIQTEGPRGGRPLVGSRIVTGHEASISGGRRTGNRPVGLDRRDEDPRSSKAAASGDRLCGKMHRRDEDSDDPRSRCGVLFRPTTRKRLAVKTREGYPVRKIEIRVRHHSWRHLDGRSL